MASPLVKTSNKGEKRAIEPVLRPERGRSDKYVETTPVQKGLSNRIFGWTKRECSPIHIDSLAVHLFISEVMNIKFNCFSQTAIICISQKGSEPRLSNGPDLTPGGHQPI